MPKAALAIVGAARQRLFDLIDATPNLDWLLLTKRPENIAWQWRFPKYRWCIGCDITASVDDEGEKFFWMDSDANGGDGAWRCRQCDNEESYARKNVWLGTSVEDQEQADKRITELLNVPAAVRFLSMEPLLGPIDLSGYLPNNASWKPYVECRHGYDACPMCDANPSSRIDWVVVGGESGPNARPMHPDWARSLRDQCAAAGVAYFFKQGSQANWPKFKDFDNLPAEFQIREFPNGIK